MTKLKTIIIFIITLVIAFVLVQTKAVAFSSIQSTPSDTTTKDSIDESYETHSWGSYDPGKGFLVGKNKYGSLNISAYVVVRYINQLPGRQTFIDHLGRTHNVDGRNDIQFHRVLLTFAGFLYKKNLGYMITVWTVNSTQQVAVVGALNYKFHKRFDLFGGIIGNAGTRSLVGSHPYWLAPDRVMADEFFRPGFTSGVWATGELFPKFFYKAMLGNNLSQLGITATALTRSLTPSASIWWMPTTGEFGPRGGFGDFETHKKLATRFGSCFTHARENRFNDLSERSPDNTQVRISDGLLFFERGALADSVTVIDANFDLLAIDAGIKYKGMFLQTEYYFRKLSKFNTDGPVPLSSIFDQGFYIQLSFFAIPKKIELYTATSHIFGEFRNSYEYLGGVNYYPTLTRNFRVNAQVISVYRSPTGSTFGYYVAGQRGTTVSLATSVFF